MQTQSIGAGPARFQPPASRAETDLAHEKLMSEVIAAMSAGNADELLWTPGWSANGHATLDAVLCDAMAGTGDTTLAEMLALVPLCLKSTDPLLRLTAQALVAKVARAHADFHADDGQKEIDIGAAQ
jgi:hypothetical protein